MYYIKIKCQRMVGQCPACPIGRAVAGIIIIFPVELYYLSYEVVCGSHSECENEINVCLRLCVRV